MLLVTVILVIIRNNLSNLVDNLNFTDIDKILGVILGLVKGVFLLSAVLIFLRNHPVFNIDRVINKSILYPLIERVFIALLSLFPKNIVTIIYVFLGIE